MNKISFIYPDDLLVTKPFRVSAVVTSGNIFSLVTLNWTGRSMRLAPTACLTLPVDEERVTHPQFEHWLELFTKGMEIPHVVIRRGPDTGPHKAAPLAVKVETILEFIPSVGTSRVHACAVTGWVNRANWLLPLPQDELTAPERKVQQRCIETAAFVVARVLEHRASLFPDGPPPTWIELAAA
ncbi:hypothetical protein [Parafrankia sp. BMG5.11]|uniref:hypothetical protein n=1 Tax=Parafrankia sp. BMG5.11 TaxID=222540 RepID=UPI00103D2081|nr:hypothetical protein [Parafrankia sp. BMG5.11]TCJ39098.1 hypothetical protein E0504_12540 [Parafrankia sp. BMG5.11]